MRKIKTSIQFCGIAGLILLIFGCLSKFIITYDYYLVVPTHLVLGILLLLIFLINAGGTLLHSISAQRRAGFGAGATLYTALFVGVLMLINYVVSQHDFLHFDSTEQKVYTLAPQTESVLTQLPEPVEAYAFYAGGVVDIEVQDLLTRMQKASSHFTWKSVDPDRRPDLVEKFGIRESGTVYLAFKDNEKKRSTTISREVTEQTVVNSLRKLTRGGEKVVYWLRGHGEPDPNDGTDLGYEFLRQALEGENLKVSQLYLSENEVVPDDAAALFVIAPQKAILDVEREKITAFLEKGGNAIFFSEPKSPDDIRKFVAPLGIGVGTDIVVDQVVRLFAGPGLGVQPVVKDFGVHPITAGFDEAIVFSTVSSVRKTAGESGKKVQELALTSAQSWGETNLEKLFREPPSAELDGVDLSGPVSVAAAYDGKSTSPGAQNVGDGKFSGRVVVLGDGDFIANVNLGLLFNRDFVLNCVNWVIGDNENVTIRPRSLRGATEPITQEQFVSMFVATAIFLPELLLLLGFIVWAYRKE